MFCTACGTAINPGTSFCKNCGKAIADKSKNVSNQPTTPLTEQFIPPVASQAPPPVKPPIYPQFAEPSHPKQPKPIPSQAPYQWNSPAPPVPAPLPTKSRKSNNRIIFLTLAIVLVLGVGIGSLAVWRLTQDASIPQAIVGNESGNGNLTPANETASYFYDEAPTETILTHDLAYECSVTEEIPELPEETPEETYEPNNEEEWFVLYFSSSRPVTYDDLIGLSAEELRIARNEIFARHGRRFVDAELQAHFNTMPWYTPTLDYGVEPVLSDVELANAEFIRGIEAGR